MQTKTRFLSTLVLGLLAFQPALAAKNAEAAAEHLGVAKVSIESRQVGNDLVIGLWVDLKEIIALAVSTPDSVEDLVRVVTAGEGSQALAERIASRGAKASIRVSTPSLEGGYKVRLEHDLSTARQLDVTVFLSDGTAAPLHFLGTVTNDALGVARDGTTARLTHWAATPAR